MESRQFADVKVRPRRLAATKDFRGSKYQIYSETEEEIESSPTRGTPFLQRYKKYLRCEVSSLIGKFLSSFII